MTNVLNISNVASYGDDVYKLTPSFGTDFRAFHIQLIHLHNSCLF